MWIGDVELSHALQHLETASTHAPLGEVRRQALEQSRAILCAVCAALLEFDDVGADEPVAEDETLVNRCRRTIDRRGVGLGDGRQEPAVDVGEKTVGRGSVKTGARVLHRR